MRDWSRDVRENLRDLKLDTKQKEQIVAELAAHLTDQYEEFQAQGMPESRAVERCLEEVGEWSQISRGIRNATRDRFSMNYRVKALWLPGLTTLTVASISMMVLQRVVSFQPGVHLTHAGALVLYLPWLWMLPGFGAGGAYLSRLAGAGPLTRLTVALFPATTTLTLFCLILPFTLLFDGVFIFRHLSYLALPILNWVVFPALALLGGALPVCIGRINRPVAATA